ncbi:uncharacterized protein EI97DRAFT_219469 [Westerdykella ornata]|uniref:Uncharacterized protein n=1 Tax=Westerdykella ornata TaxID=318751 RepID=A0A6A6JUT3_WESOR|nr:uncharacterized protein EI97DRAFT_219469 [Westerdykella ornata]KAF2278799.1 hypothetical protein EI97DRAFT_219469 [Westerdykella ornata]
MWEWLMCFETRSYFYMLVSVILPSVFVYCCSSSRERRLHIAASVSWFLVRFGGERKTRGWRRSREEGEFAWRGVGKVRSTTGGVRIREM